jgi:hypothetical protein
MAQSAQRRWPSGSVLVAAGETGARQRSQRGRSATQRAQKWRGALAGTRSSKVYQVVGIKSPQQAQRGTVRAQAAQSRGSGAPSGNGTEQRTQRGRRAWHAAQTTSAFS